MANFDGEKPIYIQMAEWIEENILTGVFPEETQIPSTTEISAMYRINPATALKGVNILVDKEIIYKKRGLGMFLCSGDEQKMNTAFTVCSAYTAYVNPPCSTLFRAELSPTRARSLLTE